MVLIRLDENGDADPGQVQPLLRNNDYDDEEGEACTSSSAYIRRRQLLEAVSFPPGSRPGAELSLYIEKVGDKWQICETKFGAARCSLLVFFCYQRSALRSPTASQQEEWKKNPGGKAAHIEDETKFLLDIMHSKSHTMLTMTRLLWKISP
jgi:hypothetical protein